jgi:hypothetical protein
MEVNDSSIEEGTVRATMKSPICKIVILILHMARFLSPLMEAREEREKGGREECKKEGEKEKVSATAVEKRGKEERCTL